MKNICDPSKCTGCGACFNICKFGAIKMTLNDEGFLVPIIDPKKCTNCGQCVVVCPSNKFNRFKRNKSPLAYLLWNKNQELRYKSASGGAFVLFANHILNQGGRVYGAVYAKDFSVEIISIEKKEELYMMQGSKYVQSNTLNTFKQVEEDLKADKLVLYTGLPCQIAGLYAYLKYDYDNLYTLDLVCHGTPSIGLFKSYLKDIEEKLGDEICYINQKEPGKKWTPLIQFNIKIKTKKGKEMLSTTQKDPYINAFCKLLSFNKCCYKCKYSSLPRVADITLGDFFGLGVLYKYCGKDTSKGVSQILINSHKGKQLFEDSKKESYYEKRKLNECTSFNYNIWRPSKKNPKRDVFYEDFKTMSFDKLNKKYMSDNIKSKITRCVKSLIKKCFGDRNVIRIMYYFSKIKDSFFK